LTARITRDIIESYLSCKYKGYLRLGGQRGIKSDYELLLAESREEVRKKATAGDSRVKKTNAPRWGNPGALGAMDVGGANGRLGRWATWA
jgi:hypothetical protein